MTGCELGEASVRDRDRFHAGSAATPASGGADGQATTRRSAARGLLMTGQPQSRRQPQLECEGVPTSALPAGGADLVEHLTAKRPHLLALLANDSGGSVERQVEDPAVIQQGQLFASTEQLARRFGVEPRWIRARADKLGGVRISDASNSKLRYDLRIADAYMDSQRLQPKEAGLRRKAPRRHGTRSTGTLIPFV